uniref:30S ribosomal protein S25e n=1 Tax=Ignisphaera aggregans TaxID=334771 RepID=A0A7C2VGK0_9CREN
MGTKGGKPISSLEKRRAKTEKREEKKVSKEEKRELRLSTIDPSLVKRVAEDIKNMPFVTTYAIAQKHGIKHSAAKKILRELASQKLIDIVLSTRRVIVAVPAKSSASNK